MADHREYYRRNLPHWQPEGATLFITTRLAGSLPRKVIDGLMVERKDEIEALTQITPQDEYKRVLYRGERINNPLYIRHRNDEINLQIRMLFRSCPER